MKIIPLESLSSMLSNGAPPVLVEALPAKLFNDGHLPGAININYDEVKQKASLLPTDRDAEIVVYCASATCANSHKVALQLVAMGYRNVAVFSGGKADWQAAGRSLVEV